MAEFVTRYEDDLRYITPRFFYDAAPDAPKSEVEGRVVYKDAEEMVEVRTVGDPLNISVFPANALWKRVGFERVTYAKRFEDQYEQFKAGREQTKAGMRIEGAPFLSLRQQKELIAAGVLTIESLAALEGRPLKNLGVHGRDMKEKAVEFLEKLARGEDSDIASLKAEIERLKAIIPATQPKIEAADDELSSMSEDELRDLIRDATGKDADRRWSRSTLEDAVRKVMGKEAA